MKKIVVVCMFIVGSVAHTSLLAENGYESDRYISMPSSKSSEGMMSGGMKSTPKESIDYSGKRKVSGCVCGKKSSRSKKKCGCRREYRHCCR